MTLKDLREMIRDMPDEAVILYREDEYGYQIKEIKICQVKKDNSNYSPHNSYEVWTNEDFKQYLDDCEGDGLNPLQVGYEYSPALCIFN